MKDFNYILSSKAVNLLSIWRIFWKEISNFQLRISCQIEIFLHPELVATPCSLLLSHWVIFKQCAKRGKQIVFVVGGSFMWSTEAKCTGLLSPPPLLSWQQNCKVAKAVTTCIIIQLISERRGQQFGLSSRCSAERLIISYHKIILALSQTWSPFLLRAAERARMSERGREWIYGGNYQPLSKNKGKNTCLLN